LFTANQAMLEDAAESLFINWFSSSCQLKE
jgi:hypothetical protein